MTTLVQQKSTHDCVMCCMAMALGLTWDEIYKRLGTDHPNHEAGTMGGLGWWFLNVGAKEDLENLALNALGLVKDRDYKRFHWSLHWSSAGWFRGSMWGRRAIVVVRSRNKQDGHHAIYWDGEKLWDPSTLDKYVEWEEVEPYTVIVFKETPRATDPAV